MYKCRLTTLIQKLQNTSKALRILPSQFSAATLGIGVAQMLGVVINPKLSAASVALLAIEYSAIFFLIAFIRRNHN